MRDGASLSGQYSKLDNKQELFLHFLAFKSASGELEDTSNQSVIIVLKQVRWVREQSHLELVDQKNAYLPSAFYMFTPNTLVGHSQI
jgi:hypothetical protein